MADGRTKRRGSGPREAGGESPISRICVEDMEDFARGAAFLGTGGGGDPYIGRLLAENAIREHGAPRVIQVEDLADDDAVFPVAMVGAPTVMIEKAVRGEDADLALAMLEERVDRRATAIVSAEIGGLNATLPVMMAARRGLPLVDGDGMGRAFPEIQMCTFNVRGVSASPMSIVNEHLERVLIEARTAVKTERLARAVVSEMGLSVMASAYPMTGAEARDAVVPRTLSAALGVGRAIRRGRAEAEPVEALLAFLRSTPYYSECRVLFDGKIVDVRRETTRGFAIGECLLEDFAANERMSVSFQNEFLVAKTGGRTLAIVPDLICVVDRETGEPITTEALRYGQRVKVIGTSAAPIMRAPESLAVFGPRAFGLDEDFVPIEKLNDDDAAGAREER